MNATTNLTNYLMTEVEYSDYKNEVLSKTSSGNIHKITNMLAAVKNFNDLAFLKPNDIDFFVEMILNTKADIYQMTKC